MSLITTVKKTISAVSELLKVAGANSEVKEAGSEVAKSVLTIAKFVNVLLLPLTFLNWLCFQKIPVLRRRKRQGDSRSISGRNVASGDRPNESELSLAEAAVLLAMLKAAPRRVTASDLARLIQIPPRKLYLILNTFEANKWVTSEFESSSTVIGGPRRRYYQLTELGFCKARESCALMEFMSPDCNQVRVQLSSVTSSDGCTRG